MMPNRGCGLVLAAVLTLGACGGAEMAEMSEASPPRSPETASATTDDETATPSAVRGSGSLWLRFHDAWPGAMPSSFVNSGDSPVDVEAATWGTGQVRSARSPHGRAVRFPAYDAEGRGFAILSVINSSDEDGLSPGDADFSFGADFAIDDTTTGTPADDGDNLIQRGLYEGSSQYKIQIDDGRPSCRLQGLTGEVMVTVPARATPREWYRVRCTRRDNTVTLEMGRLPESGPVEWTAVSRSAPLGSIIMSSHTPLSVGGKLAEDGTIYPSSTDQFNGSIDRVVFRVLE